MARNFGLYRHRHRRSPNRSRNRPSVGGGGGGGGSDGVVKMLQRSWRPVISVFASSIRFGNGETRGVHLVFDWTFEGAFFDQGMCPGQFGLVPGLLLLVPSPVAV